MPLSPVGQVVQNSEAPPGVLGRQEPVHHEELSDHIGYVGEFDQQVDHGGVVAEKLSGRGDGVQPTFASSVLRLSGVRWIEFVIGAVARLSVFSPTSDPPAVGDRIIDVLRNELDIFLGRIGALQALMLVAVLFYFQRVLHNCRDVEALRI